MSGADSDELLTPAQVARAFCVDPRTVTRWANENKLTVRWTVGGHRRYLRNEVKALGGLVAEAPEPGRPPRAAVGDMCVITLVCRDEIVSVRKEPGAAYACPRHGPKKARRINLLDQLSTS